MSLDTRLILDAIQKEQEYLYEEADRYVQEYWDLHMEQRAMKNEERGIHIVSVRKRGVGIEIPWRRRSFRWRGASVTPRTAISD